MILKIIFKAIGEQPFGGETTCKPSPLDPPACQTPST